MFLKGVLRCLRQNREIKNNISFFERTQIPKFDFWVKRTGGAYYHINRRPRKKGKGRKEKKQRGTENLTGEFLLGCSRKESDE